MSTSSKVKAYFYPGRGGSFWVEVPALPGCTSWGRTHDEALENAYEQVMRAVETFRAIGRPVPWQAEPEGAPAGSEVVELDPSWDEELPPLTPEEEAEMEAENARGESIDLADLLRSYGIDVRRGTQP